MVRGTDTLCHLEGGERPIDKKTMKEWENNHNALFYSRTECVHLPCRGTEKKGKAQSSNVGYCEGGNGKYEEVGDEFMQAKACQVKNRVLTTATKWGGC